MNTQTDRQVIEFEQVVERGCGMDVHKESVVATVAGIGIKQETRTFSTFTNSLRELKVRLKSFGITDVAMESTGVYWKPGFNVMEEDFKILLVGQECAGTQNRQAVLVEAGWVASRTKNT